MAGEMLPTEREAPGDVNHSLRIGLWVLGLGLGGFVLWATTVPLDEGVPAPAVIVAEANSTLVQHAAGGVVAAVHVREGQKVDKGEVLVLLNDVDSKAARDAARAQWISLRAAEARLVAEQSGAPTIDFPPDLLQMRAEPMAQQQIALQRELFATRKRVLQSELSTLGQQLAATQASLDGIRQTLAAREQQLGIIEQELTGVRQMVADGFLARTRQNDLERHAAESRAALADLRGNQAKLTEFLVEVRMRQHGRQQEYRKEVEAQLADVRRETALQAEKLRSADEHQDRSAIRAPLSGQVVGLTVPNAGGVIAPGDKLMEIVPGEARLVLQAQIATHLIDRIQAGLPADIHLQAFVNLPQLVVPGRVVSVSATALTDAQARTSYYLARVEVTEHGLRLLRGHQLQPGMPADVVVKTGERTLLNYLLRPLYKRLAESMKEA